MSEPNAPPCKSCRVTPSAASSAGRNPLALLLFSAFFAVMGLVLIGLIIYRFDDNGDAIVLALFVGYALFGISALFLVVHRLETRQGDQRGAKE